MNITTKYELEDFVMECVEEVVQEGFFSKKKNKNNDKQSDKKNIDEYLEKNMNIWIERMVSDVAKYTGSNYYNQHDYQEPIEEKHNELKRDNINISADELIEYIKTNADMKKWLSLLSEKINNSEVWNGYYPPYPGNKFRTSCKNATDEFFEILEKYWK